MSDDTTEKKEKGDNTPKKNPADHLADYKWKPGTTPNPIGRPKGSRNKLGEDFVAALQADFAEHGVTAIQEVRETRPADYLKVIAGILPKELNITKTTVEELSDDDLARALATLQAIVAADATGERSEPETKH